MQIKPVTKADKPEYPTASEIDIPKVLNASKPNNWKRNAAIGAVMMGMLFSVNSCKLLGHLFFLGIFSYLCSLFLIYRLFLVVKYDRIRFIA